MSNLSNAHVALSIIGPMGQAYSILKYLPRVQMMVIASISSIAGITGYMTVNNSRIYSSCRALFMVLPTFFSDV